MKTKNGQLLLKHMPHEIKREILEWLPTSDLLAVRMTGKEYQEIADSILKWRKSEIVVDSRGHCFEKVSALLNRFSKARKITFRNRSSEEIEVTSDDETICTYFFAAVLKQCKCTLRKLISLELDDACFHERHISLLPIENLRELSLKNVIIDDDSMSNLFRALPELRIVHIESRIITGKCFEDIGSKVRSVSWFNRGPELRTLTFSSNATNIDEFEYSNEQMLTGDTQIVIETVGRELCNLKSLKLSTDDVIFDFTPFKVNSLQSLDLTVFELQEIIPDLRMPCVKTFSITLSNYNDTDLVTLLYKFPCVERLTLDFSYNFRFLENPLSPKVIEAIADLMFLRSFSFFDKLYEHDQYLCESGANSILQLISALNFVECIELELKSIDHSEHFFEMKNAVESIAKQAEDKQRYHLCIE